MIHTSMWPCRHTFSVKTVVPATRQVISSSDSIACQPSQSLLTSPPTKSAEAFVNALKHLTIMEDNHDPHNPFNAFFIDACTRTRNLKREFVLYLVSQIQKVFFWNYEAHEQWYMCTYAYVLLCRIVHHQKRRIHADAIAMMTCMSFVVSQKILDDEYYENRAWALQFRNINISLQRFNDLEVRFLKLCAHETFVRRDQLCDAGVFLHSERCGAKRSYREEAESETDDEQSWIWALRRDEWGRGCGG